MSGSEYGPPSGSAAAVAAAHLRETGNVGVGWGDGHLLHEIADKLGMPHESFSTERKVLNRIDRTHRGHLVKRIVSLPERGRGADAVVCAAEP